jgi:hypothetical protein
MTLELDRTFEVVDCRATKMKQMPDIQSTEKSPTRISVIFCPHTVTRIRGGWHKRCFKYAEDLKTFLVPANVQRIRRNAFCMLRKIIFLSGKATISSDAFDGAPISSLDFRDFTEQPFIDIVQSLGGNYFMRKLVLPKNVVLDRRLAFALGRRLGRVIPGKSSQAFSEMQGARCELIRGLAMDTNIFDLVVRIPGGGKVSTSTMRDKTSLEEKFEAPLALCVRGLASWQGRLARASVEPPRVIFSETALVESRRLVEVREKWKLRSTETGTRPLSPP